jgi:uncharacterized protein YndB with AHSA1/START domain
MTGDRNQRETHLRIERGFHAPVEDLYRVWTTPEDLVKWAWGSLGKDVTAEVDLRPGGHYRIETSRPDGSRWSFSGKYLEVVPRKRLVTTVTWHPPMKYESPGEKVTVEFHPLGRQTTVVFTHEGVPDADARKEHIRGWQNTFDHVERLLEAAEPT